jgi:hypothetical protein
MSLWSTGHFLRGPYPNSTPTSSHLPGRLQPHLSDIHGTYYFRTKATAGYTGPAPCGEKLHHRRRSTHRPLPPSCHIIGGISTFNANMTRWDRPPRQMVFQYGTVQRYYSDETAATAKSTAGTVSFPQALSASSNILLPFQDDRARWVAYGRGEIVHHR